MNTKQYERYMRRERYKAFAALVFMCGALWCLACVLD